MKTLNLLPILLLSFLLQQLSAQPLTSRDIRHASGKGPYPVYVNVMATNTGMGSTFGPFIDDYLDFKRPFYPKLRKARTMPGVEVNLGVVINTDHFLGITGFRLNRLSLEGGYRYLHRDLRVNGSGYKPLHLREDVASVRIGMRGNILYPITYQLQAGPIIYHHTEAIDELVRVAELFTGPFPAGWDLRGRIMLFDPAGTAGGLGLFVEGRYLITSRGRDLTEFYQTIMGDSSGRDTHFRWNYLSWSVGVVVPLALRWI